jgi:hypothetical protein
MIFYKNNSDRAEYIDEPLKFDIPPKGSVNHWSAHVNYDADKVHDSLQRCSDCGFKYESYRLVRIDLGMFLCKFCMKGAA